MTKRLLIVGFLILSVLVLRCGPTDGPGDADGASSDSAEVQPTPTYTPWPTKPTSTPAPKPPLQTHTHEPPSRASRGVGGVQGIVRIQSTRRGSVCTLVRAGAMRKYPHHLLQLGHSRQRPRLRRKHRIRAHLHHVPARSGQAF